MAASHSTPPAPASRKVSSNSSSSSSFPTDSDMVKRERDIDVASSSTDRMEEVEQMPQHEHCPTLKRVRWGPTIIIPSFPIVEDEEPINFASEASFDLLALRSDDSPKTDKESMPNMQLGALDSNASWSLASGALESGSINDFGASGSMSSFYLNGNQSGINMSRESLGSFCMSRESMGSLRGSFTGRSSLRGSLTKSVGSSLPRWDSSEMGEGAFLGKLLEEEDEDISESSDILLPIPKPSPGWAQYDHRKVLKRQEVTLEESLQGSESELLYRPQSSSHIESNPEELIFGE